METSGDGWQNQASYRESGNNSLKTALAQFEPSLDAVHALAQLVRGVPVTQQSEI